MRVCKSGVFACEALVSCRVLHSNDRAVFCTMRTRLRCEIYHGGEQTSVRHVFNECCIDRGASTAFMKMDCFIDGAYITTVQVG